MKIIIALIVLSFSSAVSAKNVYIGSFYNKVDIHTNVIYKPKDIKDFIDSHEFKKSDRVVLSSGIENSCGDYHIVKDQIDSLSKKVSKIYLIRNQSCFGVSAYMKKVCEDNKQCEYVDLYEVKK